MKAGSLNITVTMDADEVTQKTQAIKENIAQANELLREAKKLIGEIKHTPIAVHIVKGEQL